MPWTEINKDIESIVSQQYQKETNKENFYTSLKVCNFSSTVACQTKWIFSRYGILKEVIPNNGLEFIGHSYRNVSNHNKSSSGYR